MKHKLNILLIFAVIFLVVSQSCKKEEIAKNDIKEGYKDYLSITFYDYTYKPEGNIESQMQEFFGNLNNYHENQVLPIYTYNFNDGLWFLISGLNYVAANSYSEITPNDTMLSLSLSFENVELNSLSSADLFETFDYAYNNIMQLKNYENEVGMIAVNSLTIEGNSIKLNLDVTYGKLTIYEDVDLNNPPNPVDYFGLKTINSSSKLMAEIYNSYLTKAKLFNVSHVAKKILIENPSTSIIGWTNGDNCYNQWPNGDFILYNCCTQYNSNNASIDAQRFNNYMLRFFNKKVVGWINDNLQYQRKTFYMIGSWGHLYGCNICSYIVPCEKDAVIMVSKMADVRLLSQPLNTYTY
jgi:hypothetical protein